MDNVNTAESHYGTVELANSNEIGDRAYDTDIVNEARYDSSHYDDAIKEQIQSIDAHIKNSEQQGFKRDEFSLDPKLNFDPSTALCRDPELDHKVKEELRYNQELYRKLEEEARLNRDKASLGAQLIGFLRGGKGTVESAFAAQMKNKHITTLENNTNLCRKAEQRLADTYTVATQHFNKVNELRKSGHSAERLWADPEYARATKMHVAATKEWLNALNDTQKTILDTGATDVAEVHNADAIEELLNHATASKDDSGKYSGEVNQINKDMAKSYMELAPVLDKNHVGNVLENSESNPEAKKRNEEAMKEFMESVEKMFSRLSSFLGIKNKAKSSSNMGMR